jgi:hypothetical protein
VGQAEKEYKRFTDPKFAQREHAAERAEKKKEFAGDMQRAGECLPACRTLKTGIMCAEV